MEINSAGDGGGPASQPATAKVEALPEERPSFSDVSQRTPTEAIAYLRGQLPGYPGSSRDSVVGFSTSDILETMDTSVVDAVQKNGGAVALQQMYDLIARSILDTLVEQYGDQWVLVPLDAGHGGDRDIFWDSGANGTEAIHTRAVIADMLKLLDAPSYGHVILRPVFNDHVSEDFGLPGGINEPLVNATLIRQIRASMLAAEAAAWNKSHGPSSQVVVHELSVHFNSGAGGAMVLNQGDTVPVEFRLQSVDFARRFLHRVVPALNATGLLPSPLKLWGTDGTHDDVMLYNPDANSHRGIDDHGITLRYGMLQGGGYTPYYIGKILKYGLGGDVYK